MSGIVYSLCAITALACSYLLLQAFWRGGYRLLLWSGICFAGLTVNNLLLVYDKIVVPGYGSLLLAHVGSAHFNGCSALRVDMGHTINIANSVLSGAVAMASFVAMLFFLKFWRQTRDGLFLLFALAFGIDAIMRTFLGLDQVRGEAEPFFYTARLVSFLLIIVAIVQKNRPKSHR